MKKLPLVLLCLGVLGASQVGAADDSGSFGLNGYKVAERQANKAKRALFQALKVGANREEIDRLDAKFQQLAAEEERLKAALSELEYATLMVEAQEAIRDL